MPTFNLFNSISNSGQFPVASKYYFLTLAELQSLGTSNDKANSYYEDMKVHCVETHKEYIWREVLQSDAVNSGLVSPNYTYPAGHSAEGVDYGGRTFNFFEIIDKEGTGGGTTVVDLDLSAFAPNTIVLVDDSGDDIEELLVSNDFIISLVNGKKTLSLANVSTPDTTAPVITLIGNNPQIIQVNGSYTELGATAIDNEDGNISNLISINAAGVNTSVPGNYSVTYDVADSAGNTAIQVTRTIQIVDNENPIITLVGANPQVIEVGTAYTELGATATDTPDGDITGDIVILVTVDTNTPGTYTVTYNVQDNAGNNATPVVRNIQVVDTTPPSIPVLSVDNVTGSQVSLSWTASTDNVAVEDYQLSYTLVTDTFWTSPITINTINLSHSFSNLANGDYKFRVRAKDTSDVFSTYSNIPEATINVATADTEVPTTPLNLVANSDGTDITVTWTQSTDNVGILNYQLQRTLTTDTNWDNFTQILLSPTNSYVDTGLADGTYKYRIIAIDTSNNPSTPSNEDTATVTVGDIVAPTIVLSGDNPLSLTVGDAYVEAGAAANDETDGDLTGSIIISGSVDTNTEGTYTITYTVSDSAGNTAQETRTVNVVAASAELFVYYGQAEQTVPMTSFTLNEIDPAEQEVVTPSIVGFKRDIQSPNVNNFSFLWDGNSPHENKSRHFIAIPPGVTLLSVVSDAFGGENYYTNGGTNLYTVTTITHLGVTYTVYVYDSIAPSNSNLAIDFSI